MSLLSENDKERIKKRRENICDRDGRKHHSSTLILHHKDRDTHNNVSTNLRVLCKKHHKDLHASD